MVILYTSPGCASCRKAKRFLQDNHISFIEKNIFSNLLKEDEIKYLLSRCECGTEDIISTRSNAFKNLKKDIDDFTLNELVEFILKNPSVLKRPIMLSEKSLVIGYDDDEITTFIPRDENFASRPLVFEDEPGSMYFQNSMRH
jgi:regulatory protein spx